MDDVDRTAAAALREARFRAVFAEVHEPVHRYVLRRAEPSFADDVVADALLVLWRRLDDVPAGAELPWTYGVARRCLANHRRAQERQLGLVARLADQPSGVIDPDNEDDRVRVALRRLPGDDREVLQLWAWEGLASREIAAVLGITANAASIRLHRAKRRLKAVLTGESRLTGKESTGAGHPAGDMERTAG